MLLVIIAMHVFPFSALPPFRVHHIISCKNGRGGQDGLLFRCGSADSAGFE